MSPMSQPLQAMLVSACLQALRLLCRHTGVNLELRRLGVELSLFELVLALEPAETNVLSHVADMLSNFVEVRLGYVWE